LGRHARKNNPPSQGCKAKDFGNLNSESTGTAGFTMSSTKL
jgi:hypothetical protein